MEDGIMPRAGFRKRLVILEWMDRDIEDCDEIFVFAEADDEAIAIAKKRWRLTIGAEWPHCRLKRAYVMTKSEVRAYC
jgi:hypothetical protein